MTLQQGLDGCAVALGTNTDVKTLAEQLHPIPTELLAQDLERLACRSRDELKNHAFRLGLETRRLIQREPRPGVEHHDARATLRLVEIRRRHDDRQSLSQE